MHRSPSVSRPSTPSSCSTAQGAAQPRRCRRAITTCTVYYQEPVARNLREGWLGLNRWWADLKMNGGMKTALLAVAIIFAAFNAGTILSLVITGLMLYVPYYCVWWLLKGPTPARRSPAFMQPPVRSPQLLNRCA